MNPPFHPQKRNHKILLFCFIFETFVLTLLPSPAKATILKEQTLHRYSDLLTLLKDLKKDHSTKIPGPTETLIASDWDEVVDFDGKIAPDTARTIHHLVDQRYNYLVITARNAGRYIKDFPMYQDGTTFDEDYKEMSEEMNRALHDAQGSSPLLRGTFLKPFQEFKFLQSENARFAWDGRQIPVTWVLFQGILFAGVPKGREPLKGEALAKLLDSGKPQPKQKVPPEKLIQNQPSLVLFIDDNKDNIKSVRETFTGRSEQVILLLFQPDPSVHTSAQAAPLGTQTHTLPKPGSWYQNHWLFDLINNHDKNASPPSPTSYDNPPPNGDDADLPPLEKMEPHNPKSPKTPKHNHHE